MANNKLQEKLADFMQSDTEAEKFLESVKKRQKDIEDGKMITRGENGEEKNQEGKDEEVEVVETEAIDDQPIDILLSEELIGEFDVRAQEVFKTLISPVNGIINDMKESYEKRIASLETEIKTLSNGVGEIKKVADKVEEVIQTETPSGRRQVRVSIQRPSQQTEAKDEKEEPAYVDTVEMRNKRFESLKHSN